MVGVLPLLYRAREAHRMAPGSGEKHFQFPSPKRLIWKLTDAARQLRQTHTLPADAALGRRGEDIAHRYLQCAGFKIVARNFRVAGGEAEIDLVARDKEITVFVEVKTRRTFEYGDPERAISEQKRR